MKKFIQTLLVLAFCVVNINVFAQALNIQFQKSLGGTGAEMATDSKQTSDGGYIVVGHTTSNDGDVTVNHGAADMWAVKMDNTGAIEWQKTYGGTGDDAANSVFQTSDGGYIIAGYSTSSDGDVISGNQGMEDYWVVKVDAFGAIEWEKTYGGSGNDVAHSISQTNDGGYIVAGFAASLDGDVTGNHGSYDFWVLKLDVWGSVTFEKSLGGSNYDDATYIQQTSDGGYIVTGKSLSSADGDVAGLNHGIMDFWVVKLDLNGTIEWEKLYGGSAEEEASYIQETADGGYIVSGYTESLNDGDVTGHKGQEDYWVVKLDITGLIEWQSAYGGNSVDLGGSTIPTADGGYMLIGRSASVDGDISNPLGGYDYWMVKLNSTGVIAWEKSYGGSNSDGYITTLLSNSTPFIRQTSDGGFVFAGNSKSTDGNVTGNHGDYDMWVVKLFPPLEVSVSSTDVSCNALCDGSVTSTVSWGTSPYFYSWSGPGAFSSTLDSPTNLCAGIYDLTVTDSDGGLATASVTITEPTPINLTITKLSDASCGACNGSIELTASGGTASLGYTYSQGTCGATFSPCVASGLCPGFISVTVTDDNSCTQTGLVTITSPPLLMVTITPTPASGANNDGMATANPSGGTPFPGPSYNYSWSPAPAAGQTTQTVTGLNANSYTVTVSDMNSCTASASATVTAPGVVVVSASIINHASCNGFADGSAKASPVSGLAPYSYTWAPSGASATNVTGSHTVTGLGAGVHTVTITDANLSTASASVTITEPPLMVIGSSTTSDVSCNAGANGAGAVSIISGGQFPLAYYWPAPAVKNSSDNTGSTAGLMTAGTYLVTVTDAKGCSQTAPLITITEPTAVAIDSITYTLPTCVNSSNATATVYVKPGSGTPGTGPQYNFIWGSLPKQFTQTATGLKGQTYSVSVFDANNCVAKGSVSIALPNPLSIVTTIMPVNCNGANSGSITATASSGTSPYSYSWTPGLKTCTAVTGSCTKTGLAVGTYNLTVTDANNCFTTNTTYVTAEVEPTISVIDERKANCPGTNGFSYVGYSSGFNIGWTPDPTGLGGSFSNDTLYAPAGTYGAVLTSQLTGCKDTLDVIIDTYVHVKPIINEPVFDTVCAGQTLMFHTPALPQTSYSWLLNGAVIPAATGDMYTTGLAGNYQVIASNFCGEDTSINHTLRIDSTAIKGIPIVASGPLDICSGKNVVLSAPGYKNYDWEKLFAGSVGAGNSKTINSAGEYYLLAESLFGCAGSSDTVTVTIKPLPNAPTIVPAGPLSFCEKSTASLEVSSPLLGYTYQWTGGSTQTKFNVSGAIPGTVTYFVTVTAPNGCTKRSTAGTAVTVKPLPTVNLNHLDRNFCFGKIDTLGLINSTGTSFLWNTGSTNDSIMITASGDYWVTATIGGAPSCSKISDTVRVIVDEGAIISVTSNKKDLDICQGDTVKLKAATGFKSYKWSNNVTTQEISITQAINDLYVTGYRFDGCAQKSTKHKVTVNPYPPVPTITRSGTVLTSSSTSNNKWFKNGIEIPGATLQSYTVNQSGSYTVRVTNGISCYSESLPESVTITGISGMHESQSLKIYPNPFSDKAKIQFELTGSSIVKLEVYNILGEKIVTLAEGRHVKGIHSYEFADVKPGIYFVRLQIDEKLITQRLTKN